MKMTSGTETVDRVCSHPGVVDGQLPRSEKRLLFQAGDVLDAFRGGLRVDWLVTFPTRSDLVSVRIPGAPISQLGHQIVAVAFDVDPTPQKAMSSELATPLNC